MMFILCVLVVVIVRCQAFRPSGNIVTRKLLVRENSFLSAGSKNKKPRVIDAIDDLGGKVTAADIAGTGASDLIGAERELLELATKFNGLATVAATNDGYIVFDFGDSAKKTLARIDRQERWLMRWRRVKPGLAVAGRMAFGLSLFASLALVTIALTVISQSSSSDDNRRSESSSSGGYYYSPSPFLYMDLLWGPRPTHYYRDPREMNFLEAVFSYVFGDGDPNAAKRTAELQAAAEIIRANDGIVFAEQLIPILVDIDPSTALPSSSQDTLVDESFVLPIVTALGGRPEVIDDTIIYIFDDLVDTAVAPWWQKNKKEIQQFNDTDEEETAVAVQSLLLYDNQKTPILNEKKLQFSRAEKSQLILSGGLGIANLLGVAVLVANLISQPNLLRLYPALKTLVIPLTAYAISYNLIPFLRSKNIDATNTKIQTRNYVRRAAADRLTRPDSGLRAKLKLAREATKNSLLRNRRRNSDTAFSSADDQSTRESNKLNKAKSDFDDFDSRLNNRSPSS